MRIRALFLPLLVSLVLAACAGGSGRQGTQISVSGTAPTTPVQSGSDVVFVMTVKNTGPYDASNIELIDNVGNQLKLVSITCTASAGAICPAAPSVEMTIPQLTNGGVLVFSVTTQLVANASGIVQNTLTANFAEEINPTGSSAAVTATAFTLSTAVVVGGTAPTGTLIGGSTAVFVMTVTNNGPDDTGAFNVYDNVGNGLVLLGITCTAANGATCPATVGVLTAVPTLPNGGILTFTVTTQVGQNVNGTVSNGLTVNVGTNPTPSSNTFYATATVVTADLAVSGTPPAGPLPAGSAGAFTMVVTNNGPGIAQNINFTNVLSPSLTASGAITCVPSGGAVCPTVLGPMMTLATMPDGGAVTFTIPFTVNAGTSGQITDTLTVSSTTDPRGNQMATVGLGSGANSVIVSETSAGAQVSAGGNAVFTAIVSNTGPSLANNINVGYVLTGPAGTVATVTCNAGAGILCPATLGANMVLPSLPVGRSVTFTFTVPVPTSASGQGAIVNTVTVSAANNTDTLEDVATAMTLPVNASNGTYQLFAANGKPYSLTINFDAGTYTITGNGETIQQSFTQVANTNNRYMVSGATQFDLAQNIIVGGQAFAGTGVLPYIAVRVFGTTIPQLAGTIGGLYDFMTLNVPAGGGAAVTSAGTLRVSGNTLAVCQAPGQVTIPQNCTSFPAGSLQNYNLNVNGNVYSGVNTIATSPPLPFTFQLAIIGSSSAIVSAQPLSDGSQQLLVGVPDGATIAGGLTHGASTSGDFVAVTLSPDNFSYTGVLGSTDSAPLARITPNAAPFSMITGDLVSDGAPIYVMQSYPLTIAFGEDGGAASGLLQITLP